MAQMVVSHLEEEQKRTSTDIVSYFVDSHLRRGTRLKREPVLFRVTPGGEIMNHYTIHLLEE